MYKMLNILPNQK